MVQAAPAANFSERGACEQGAQARRPARSTCPPVPGAGGASVPLRGAMGSGCAATANARKARPGLRAGKGQAGQRPGGGPDTTPGSISPKMEK